MFSMLAGVLLLLTSSIGSGSGECAGFSLDHYERTAGLIFSGTIAEVRRIDDERQVVAFEVDQVWKGKVGKRTAIHQLVESIDSIRFGPDDVGKKYLVFALRLNNKQLTKFGLQGDVTAFGVPVCGGGTRLFKPDDPDVSKLGAGRKPR
jgi:hypothetical protein